MVKVIVFLATLDGEGITGTIATGRELSIDPLADFERYKAAAKRAARIEDGRHHKIFAALPEFPPAGLG